MAAGLSEAGRSAGRTGGGGTGGGGLLSNPYAFPTTFAGALADFQSYFNNLGGTLSALNTNIFDALNLGDFGSSITDGLNNVIAGVADPNNNPIIAGLGIANPTVNAQLLNLEKVVDIEQGTLDFNNTLNDLRAGNFATAESDALSTLGDWGGKSPLGMIFGAEGLATHDDSVRIDTDIKSHDWVQVEVDTLKQDVDIASGIGAVRGLINVGANLIQGGLTFVFGNTAH